MFKDLVRSRYSVRRYSDKKVEDKKLKRIWEVGRLSPTAANLQPQKIYVLKSEEAMQKAKETTKMMYNAPLALLVCYDVPLVGKEKALEIFIMMAEKWMLLLSQQQ